MTIQTLSQGWTLQIAGESHAAPATIPGSLCGHLVAAGRLEEPFWREGTPEARALGAKEFIYCCRFVPEKALLASPQKRLRFWGVDGLGEAELNGSPLGRLENTHRAYTFDVSRLLHPGENMLKLRLLPEGAGVSRRAGFRAFGPRLPDGGIWRPVELAGLEGGEIADAALSQRHTRDGVELALALELVPGGEGVAYHASLTAPDGQERSFLPGGKPGEFRPMHWENPMLWWPRGYGGQPLYTLLVQAQKGERVLHTKKLSVGLRSLKLCTGEGGLALEINGVRVFPMGALYVPPRRLGEPREKESRLLEHCAAANFNCVRVWAGGVYEEEAFYHTCDQLGLMVWQDLMFTPENQPVNQPLSRESAEEGEAEAADIARRLRHHPSICLWCGGSGTELANLAGSPRQRADHIRFYEYILPKTLARLAPEVPYWPATPSSGGGLDCPNSRERGDTHENQAGEPARFASQFGFGSFPCLATVERFTQPRDRNLSSPVMDAHQLSPGGTGAILAGLHQEYLHPHDFDTALYASQLLQARRVEEIVEGCRRNRGSCMGVLYDRLNDFMPCASRSSIDYFGSWKALHYFARRFYAPLLLSCQRREKGIALCVVNETRRPRHVLIAWALRDRACRVRREETITLTVPALESAWLEPIALPELRETEDFLSYALYEKGTNLSFATLLFTPPKAYAFSNPGLSCRLEGDQVVVRGEAYAQGVEIRSMGEEILLEDNYFDMLPGERRVKLLSGTPRALQVRSVYNIR